MRRLVVLVALVGCQGKPPLVCAPAAVAPSDQPFFTRVTEEWGLESVRGTHINTADFDGDGRPDLLVAKGNANTVHDGTNQHVFLLRNTGSGFEDVTFAAGLAADRDGGQTRSFQLAVWGDVDNDGDLDLFTGIWLDRNALDGYRGDVNEILLNNGDGTFSLAPTSEIGFAAPLTGASFVDYDLDGHLDLLLTGWYARYGQLAGEQDRLMRGHGDGTFTDATDAVGLTQDPPTSDALTGGTNNRPSMGATTCDVDDDGDPDLLVASYGRQYNQLWINDGATFSDEAAAWGYASDAELDFSDNQFYRCYCAVNGCTPDPGPASLSDCATYAGYWSPGSDDQPYRLGGNTFTTVCADLDNDGDQDLYNTEIVHWHIGGSSDATQVLLQSDGQFTRPGNAAMHLDRAREGSWNEGDLTAAIADFDNDGHKDILLGGSDYPGTHAHLWLQREIGTYEDVAIPAGIAHERAVSPAVADFDGDGDLDVVWGSSTMRSSPWAEQEVHLYRNDLDRGAFTAISLHGDTANASGIGAKVTVEAGGTTQTWQLQGGYGHQGLQQTTSLHVGVQDACEVDITVRWPDADHTETTWRKVRAGYPVRLFQDGGLDYLTAE